MDTAFQNTVLRHLHKAADDLSSVLTAQYPPEELPDSPGQGAGALTEVVAEVLQSYLNAGSESDAIHENLGPHIEAEVRDWALSSVHPS
jgi:hypothetical protein